MIQVPVQYTPTNTEEISAKLAVEDFTYIAPRDTLNNEISFGGAQILLTEPIGKFYSNAVRREFRAAGISLRAPVRCRMNGKVSEFSINSVGHLQANYVTSVQYTVKNAGNGAVLYDAKLTQSITGPAATSTQNINPNIFPVNISKTITENIKQVLTDPTFVATVEEKCPL